MRGGGNERAKEGERNTMKERLNFESKQKMDAGKTKEKVEDKKGESIT